MKKTNKKGFTIVELVIVIAVVAILAAVLIPTFVSVVNKANVSNDTALVKNINITLAAEEITDGKPATMHDALVMAERGGFDVSKLTPRSSGDIVWDSATNRFALVDKDGKKVFSENDKDIPQNASVWKIVETGKDAADNTTYSSYIKGKSVLGDIKVSTGIDVGNNTVNGTITYVNNEKSQNSIIRTNGQMCDIKVDASKDHIEHYGFAKKVEVIAVNPSNSYHEFGTSGELIVGSGRIVVEPTGIVFELKGTMSSTATVVNNGGNVMKSSIESVIASDIFYINSLEQLEAFRDASNAGVTFSEYNSDTKKIVLNSDIILTSAWRPISNYYRGHKDDMEKWFAGYFDGNGHTIYGLSNEGLKSSEINTGYDSTTPQGNTEYVYGMFASVNGATIKNINFENVNIVSDNDSNLKGDHVAALIGFAKGDVQVSNVTVKGTISGFDGTAGIIGGIRETTEKGAKVEKCYNYATLTAERRTAGIVGNINTVGKVTINSCVNYGKITINSEVVEIQNIAAGIALTAVPNNNSYNVEVFFTDCANDGSAEIKGTSKTIAIAKITVIYTTEYNNNSTGNILNNNCDQSSIGNHVVKEDECGKLTAVSENHVWSWANN